jgi:hypothetical protein
VSQADEKKLRHIQIKSVCDQILSIGIEAKEGSGIL